MYGKKGKNVVIYFSVKFHKFPFVLRNKILLYFVKSSIVSMLRYFFQNYGEKLTRKTLSCPNLS